jgi:hypothetical protein
MVRAESSNVNNSPIANYDKWKSAAIGVGIAAAVTLAVAAVAFAVFTFAPVSLTVLGVAATGIALYTSLGGAALGTVLGVASVILGITASQKKPQVKGLFADVE